MPKRKFKPHIFISTHEQGLLKLKAHFPIGLGIKLLEKQEQWSDREFTIHTLTFLLDTPKLSLEEISKWDDKLLLSIITDWLKQSSFLNMDLDSDGYNYQYIKALFIDKFRTDRDFILHIIAGPFETKLMGVNTQIAQEMETMRLSTKLIIAPLIRAFTSTVLGSVEQNYNAIVNSLGIDRLSLALFDNLPDLDFWQRLDEAASVLNERGYGFMDEFWTYHELGPFFGVQTLDKRSQGSAITNRLLKLTKQDSFRSELKQCFDRSHILQRRWHIVESALGAHTARNYSVSIPTLLTQVEGMFTDALILKGSVVKKNNKFYARDLSSGNPKRDKNGNYIELKGLHPKVTHADLSKDERLQALAGFFTSYLASERNDILHGTIVTYGTAKLSTQLVLNIYAIALEFAEYEALN